MLGPRKVPAAGMLRMRIGSGRNPTNWITVSTESSNLPKASKSLLNREGADDPSTSGKSNAPRLPLLVTCVSNAPSQQLTLSCRYQGFACTNVSNSRLAGKQETMWLLLEDPFHANHPVVWVYECWATHAAGVSSGRRWIGRSANPGRTEAM